MFWWLTELYLKTLLKGGRPVGLARAKAEIDFRLVDRFGRQRGVFLQSDALG